MPRESVHAFGERGHRLPRILVDQDAVGRRRPARSTARDRACASYRRSPACQRSADALRREVDVLRVVLAVELRRHQPRDVHRRAAAPRRELAHFRRAPHVLGQLVRELADHVTQVVDLLLRARGGCASGSRTGCPSCAPSPATPTPARDRSDPRSARRRSPSRGADCRRAPPRSACSSRCRHPSTRCRRCAPPGNAGGNAPEAST